MKKLESWIEVQEPQASDAVVRELVVKDLKTEASELLAQWGLWARLNRLPGCYSKQPWYLPPKGYQEESTPVDIYDFPLMISDEKAIQVDKHLAGIERLGSNYLAIAKLRFIAGFSTRRIAAEMSINETKVRDLIKQSVTWVAALSKI